MSAAEPDEREGSHLSHATGAVAGFVAGWWLGLTVGGGVGVFIGVQVTLALISV